MKPDRHPGTAAVVPAAVLLLLAAWPARAEAQALPVSDDCVSCHLAQEEDRLAEPARVFESDLHAEAGFDCLACHGSGGRGALDPAAGFLAAPEPVEVPEMCGRCHSDAAYMRQFDPGLRVDQVTEFWTSRHGERLLEGDTGVATCVSCHPAHRIRPPSDPESGVYPLNVPETCGACHADEQLMQDRGLPTDQVEAFTTSIHGTMLFEDGDLGAPVCNDCHGNHGAAPPGIESVRNVCGQCHAVMAEFFDASEHTQIFEEEGLPLCATCHDHHAIAEAEHANLGERSTEVCSSCHGPDDPDGLAFERMETILDSLNHQVELARERLLEAEELGVEVSQALFELESVSNARTRARSAIHSFHSERVAEEAEAGFALTEQALSSADEAFAEFDFRRLGLGISAGIMLVLMIGLMLKIRTIEERAEALLSAVESFYERSLAISGREATAYELRLAACTLLLEAAYADETFTEDERTHLEELIRGRFALDDDEARRLLAVAEQQRQSGEGFGKIAELIARNYTPAQKRSLLNELWSLVWSDGELARREMTFMEDVSTLLGLSRDELERARADAEARAPSPGNPQESP